VALHFFEAEHFFVEADGLIEIVHAVAGVQQFGNHVF
jgi:hypothetical protein